MSSFEHWKYTKPLQNPLFTFVVYWSLLSQTISVANKTESSGKETIALITDKLNNTEKRSAEKRQSLNAENAKLKAKLQEQQRRVEHSKAEHQKRRKEQEKAVQSYQKFKEKTENASVVEGDKLRVQSLDKEALAERSKLEYNRQVSYFLFLSIWN